MSGTALYPHIVAMVYGSPWAIDPDTMAVIVGILSGRLEGVSLSPDEIEARLTEAAAQNGPRAGGKTESKIAVVPIYGVVSQRAGMLANSSGGSSVESIRRSFRGAMADKDIDGVLFEIDSPGGSVAGLPELADEIRSMRGNKPITAISNSSAFSAAYWLGAQADEFYSTPSGRVGSIGVVTVHEDRSGQLSKAGIKPTYITSSKFKAEGNMAEPLSKDAKDEAQREVDAYHGMFVQAIANGRGVEASTVESDFGQGRSVLAQDAMERGMIDDVMTLEQAVVRTAELASTRSDVVSQGSHAGQVPVSEPFATRLERVLAEAEAVAAHAHERAAMRTEQGRRLGEDTRSRLEALTASLGALVAAGPEPKAGSTASKVQVLDLMIRSLEHRSE